MSIHKTQFYINRACQSGKINRETSDTRDIYITLFLDKFGSAVVSLSVTQKILALVTFLLNY